MKTLREILGFALLASSSSSYAATSFSLSEISESLKAPRTEASDPCRVAGTRHDTREVGKQYYCGEYAFGKTALGLSPEEFDRIRFPTAQDQQDAVLWRKEKIAFKQYLTVKGKRLPFSIHARRRAELDAAGSTRVLELPNGGKFRDSLDSADGATYFQVRNDASGRFNLIAEACSYFPGVVLEGQRVRETWTKSYFVATAKATVTIDPGQLSLSYLRVCARIGIQNLANGTPLTLIGVDEAQIFGLSNSGLKVDVDGNWLMNVGDFFADLTSDQNFSEQIAAMVENKGNDYIQKKLKSGEYMNSLLKPIQSRVRTEASRKITSTNDSLAARIEDSMLAACQGVLAARRMLDARGQAYCLSTAKRTELRAKIQVRLENAAQKKIASSVWRRAGQASSESASIVIDTRAVEAQILAELLASLVR
jgi:hypothetical protein